jgi:hypothetical protein
MHKKAIRSSDLFSCVKVQCMQMKKLFFCAPIDQSILIVYTVVACCINWEKIKRTMHLA